MRKRTFAAVICAALLTLGLAACEQPSEVENLDDPIEEDPLEESEGL